MKACHLCRNHVQDTTSDPCLFSMGVIFRIINRAFWYPAGYLALSHRQNQTTRLCYSVHRLCTTMPACTHVLHINNESDRQTYTLSTSGWLTNANRCKGPFSFALLAVHVISWHISCWAAFTGRPSRHVLKSIAATAVECFGQLSHASPTPAYSCFYASTYGVEHRQALCAGCSPGHIAENIAAAAA